MIDSISKTYFIYLFKIFRSIFLATHKNGMDTLTESERSKRMKLIRCQDTAPELAVRRLVHGMGYRYRLHLKDLPGKPDLVFPARKKIIFEHGCYWHRHDDPSCKLARLPKSKLDFWLPKLEANRERDRKNSASLKSMGWRVLVIWECEITHPNLSNKIKGFLG